MDQQPPACFKRPILAFLTMLIALLPACSAAPQQPAADEILIRPAEKHQTLAGFGASGAWWAQDVGGWEADKRDQVVRLLFNPQNGIGLSIYRYNIGAGAGDYIQDRWRRAQTFEVSPGVYDWKRDANAVWMLKAAHAAGVEQFVAFSNSPPGRMTVSGVPVGEVDGKSNLRPEMIDAYSQYLIDIVRHLREDEQIPVGWISPVNEPQLDWKFANGQEGCHYSPEEVLAVTRSLAHAIQKSGLDVKISVYESGEWKNAERYFDQLLGDSEVAPLLGHLSVHSYWSAASDKRVAVNYLAKKYPAAQLWMSEWTEMKAGIDSGMESALVLANTVHEDLTIGGVSSWQYWIAVSKYSYHDGLLYVDLTQHTVSDTRRLWALGNYSRYIRPGYTRIGASASTARLNVSAYQSPDQRQLVVVVINNASSAETKTIRGIPDSYTQVKAAETSAQQALGEVDAPHPGRPYSFPAQSITTFIYTRP